MAHQSLYRQYRPRSFSEVIGQEHITNILSGQIENGTLGHAYLFAGSRGLGKTSVARIFAKELEVSPKDIYEIDAASNNSVEDIRSLTENVYTLPFESEYKVYILDEAHMLSKGAWNAFLKTLEEPPAYVIFILATTELSKVPETVQSRCQVFEFKKPTRRQIVTLLEHVLGKENYTIDTDASELIAILAHGSYRDALSVLQKMDRRAVEVEAAFGGNLKGKWQNIDRASVEAVTGAPKHDLVQSFVSALTDGNADKALAAIRKTEKESVDMSLYLELILEELRAILLVRYAPELRKEISEEVGADAYAEIERLAQAKDSKLTHNTLKVFLDAAERMRFSPVPSLPLELAVFELLGQD